MGKQEYGQLDGCPVLIKVRIVPHRAGQEKDIKDAQAEQDRNNDDHRQLWRYPDHHDKSNGCADKQCPVQYCKPPVDGVRVTASRTAAAQLLCPSSLQPFLPACRTLPAFLLVFFIPC